MTESRGWRIAHRLFAPVRATLRLWRWLTTESDDPRFLPMQVWGRKIQPVALGVSLYTAILAWAILTDSAIGQVLAGLIGEAISVVCAAATTALWWGWWTRDRSWLQRGLSWATAGIVATATTVIIDVGWSSVSAWLSAPVAIIAAGSWLLERADPGQRQMEHEHPPPDEDR